MEYCINQNPHRRCAALRGVFGLSAALLLCLNATAATPAQNTVKGAVILANDRLYEDPEDTIGRHLLSFAQTLSPQHQAANELQAALEAGNVPPPPMHVVDGGMTYALYVGELADKMVKSTSDATKVKGLFLYRMAIELHPGFERADAVLSKAIEQGVATKFDALKIGFETGTPPKLEDYDDRTTPKETLATMGVVHLSFTSANLIDAFNKLSILMAQEQMVLDIDIRRMPTKRHQNEDGVTQYFAKRAILPRDPAACRLQSGTVLEALEMICDQYSLLFTIEDRTVRVTGKLTGKDGHIKAKFISAEELVASFRARPAKSLMAYKRKPLQVKGVVSGFGEKRGAPYVHLNNDTVEIRLAPGTDMELFKKLYNSNDHAPRRRKSSYYYPYTLEFMATGTCIGTESSRVIIADANGAKWRKAYKPGQSPEEMVAPGN
jgi:hypothetical protein